MFRCHNIFTGEFQPWFHGIISRKETERLLAPLYVCLSICEYLSNPNPIIYYVPMRSPTHSFTVVPVPSSFEFLRIASGTLSPTVCLIDAVIMSLSKTRAAIML